MLDPPSATQTAQWRANRRLVREFGKACARLVQVRCRPDSGPGRLPMWEKQRTRERLPRSLDATSAVPASRTVTILTKSVMAIAGGRMLVTVLHYARRNRPVGAVLAIRTPSWPHVIVLSSVRLRSCCSSQRVAEARRRVQGRARRDQAGVPPTNGPCREASSTPRRIRSFPELR